MDLRLRPTYSPTTGRRAARSRPAPSTSRWTTSRSARSGWASSCCRRCAPHLRRRAHGSERRRPFGHPIRRSPSR